MKNVTRITRWLRPGGVDLTQYGALTNADWLEAERARIGYRGTVIPHPAGNGKIALAIGPARRGKSATASSACSGATAT